MTAFEQSTLSLNVLHLYPNWILPHVIFPFRLLHLEVESFYFRKNRSLNSIHFFYKLFHKYLIRSVIIYLYNQTVIIFEHWNNWLIFWKQTHTNMEQLFRLKKTFPMENSNLEIKRPTQLRIKYCHISIQYLQAHDLRFGWNKLQFTHETWFNMNLFVDIKQIIKKINCTRTAKMTIERTEATQSLSICEFIPKLLSESSITYKIEFTLRSVFFCYVQCSLENEHRFWIRFENGKF